MGFASYGGFTNFVSHINTKTWDRKGGCESREGRVSNFRNNNTQRCSKGETPKSTSCRISGEKSLLFFFPQFSSYDVHSWRCSQVWTPQALIGGWASLEWNWTLERLKQTPSVYRNMHVFADVLFILGSMLHVSSCCADMHHHSSPTPPLCQLILNTMSVGVVTSTFRHAQKHLAVLLSALPVTHPPTRSSIFFSLD